MKPLSIAFVLLTPMIAPLGAQAVGSLPQQSPYADVRGGQRLGVDAGYIVMSHDPAGVGPKSAPFVAMRYDFHAGSLAYLTSRAFGASTERDILDYTKKAAVRRTGTQSSTLIGADVGLALALTGDRSWHRLQPFVATSAGFATGIGDKPDVSLYTFGTRFFLTYGLGARYITGRNSEIRADIVWYNWQLKYPETFRSTDGDAVAIHPAGSMSPWTHNRAMTVGWSWGILR